MAGAEQNIIVKKAAVRYGIRDTREFLFDDTSGTDIHVTDFGVTHLCPRQADFPARCVYQGMWAGIPEPVPHRFMCIVYGVTGRVF
jgi:hypothetical protein